MYRSALIAKLKFGFLWWKSSSEFYVFLIWDFSYYWCVPTIFRKKLSNFFTRVLNPSFKFGAKGGALETWENKLFPLYLMNWIDDLYLSPRIWQPHSFFNRSYILLISIPYWSLTSPFLTWESYPTFFRLRTFIFFFPTWQPSVSFSDLITSFFFRPINHVGWLISFFY